MEFLSTREVAVLLSYSEDTIRRWFDSGELPGKRLLPDAHRRIPKTEFIQWAEERKITLDWSLLLKSE